MSGRADLVRRRAALAALACAAALAAGCGGDDEPTETSEGPPATTETAVESVPEPARTVDTGPTEAEERAQRAKQRRLRADEAKRVLKGIALALEIETVAVATAEGGTDLTVVLEHQDACRLDEDSADSLRRGVKAAAPEVERVRLRGEEARKQTLVRYQDASCRPRTDPEAPEIVFERTDGGDAFIERIAVSASPWEIEYASTAKRFRLAVIDERDRTVLSVGKPSSAGTATRLVPRAGTFTIRITSTGRWTVRVRDGS